MNRKEWRNKALSLCLIVATIATYSMVALAGRENVVGELLVSGINASGVTVNGKVAPSGLTIFSSSTIVTPEKATAFIRLGEIGNIELAPGTNFVLSYSDKGISGELLSGAISVLSAKNAVSVRMVTGEIVKLGSGESVTAKGLKAQDDDDDDDGGVAWFVWALILGGAAAGIILAATSNNNDIQLGGGTTVISPNR